MHNLRIYTLDLSQSKNFKDWELKHEWLFNPIHVESKNDGESTPTPWDADVSVIEGNVVISGGAGPSGYGRCICTIPQETFHRGYTASLEIVLEFVPEVLMKLHLLQIGYTDTATGETNTIEKIKDGLISKGISCQVGTILQVLNIFLNSEATVEESIDTNEFHKHHEKLNSIKIVMTNKIGGCSDALAKKVYQNMQDNDQDEETACTALLFNLVQNHVK